LPVGVIHDALGDFRLDAHRIETVAVAGGIRWIDDSKATNPHAAEASLRAFGDVGRIVGGAAQGRSTRTRSSPRTRGGCAPRFVIGVRPGRARDGVPGDTRPSMPLFEVATGRH
jgi:UDP-N-acetylmuramoylalanine--D-glutamate ligase